MLRKTFLFIVSYVLTTGWGIHADTTLALIDTSEAQKQASPGEEDKSRSSIELELENMRVPMSLQGKKIPLEERKAASEAEKTGEKSVGNEDREEKIVKIKQLLPGLLPILPIDPHMPADFVLGTPDQEPNLLKGIYWGAPKNIEAYLQYPEKMDGPVFRWQLSNQVIQTGPETFTGDKTLVKELNLRDDTVVKLQKSMWGRYPVLVLETTDAGGSKNYYAWVGLNNPSGKTLEISLLLPEQGKAIENSLKIWNDFLQKTEELPPDFSINAFHEFTGKGYTVFSIDAARVKVFAQRRKSDGEILLVVIPANPNTTFVYQNATGVVAKSSASEGRSLVRLQGQLLYNQGKSSLVAEASIVVYLREVDEFTINYDVLKDDKRITVVLNNKVL